MVNLLLVETDPNISEQILDIALSEGLCLSIVNRHRQLDDLILGRCNYSVILLDQQLEDTDTRSLVPDLRRKWPEASIFHLPETDLQTVRETIHTLSAPIIA